MTTRPVPGLRERKRAETQARIEAAATSLVRRDGLAETTIDAISAQADISPRTFFNYFDSKDSAILGLPSREVSDDDLRAALTSGPAGESVATAVVRMVLTVMGTPTPATSTVHRDRLAIIRAHPELISGQFGQLSDRKNRMSEAVARFLAAHPGFSDAPDIAAHADLVLSCCASAARTALHEWAATADPSTTDTIEQRALALVASTIRRLS